MTGQWVSQRLLLSTCLTVLAGAVIAAASPGDTAPPEYPGLSALATRDQIHAEQIALHLLADPSIKAEMAKARADLIRDPAAATTDGRARLDHAIQEWTISLILREAAGDTERPRILWVVDNTPHAWLGQSLPGSAVAGDNPDHIYRGAFLDGDERYELIGKIATKSPAQFSFELTRGTPGKLVLMAQTPGHADMGGQLGMLTNRDIHVESDGTFRITIDNAPADGRPNHLHAESGPLSLNIRDVLSDWQQRPNSLEIRRLGGAPHSAPWNEAQIRDRTIADLVGYVEFWGTFKNKWFGGNLQANQLVAPVARDGGWGYLSAGRYDLAADEVLLVTTQRRAADYTGVQITDPWMIAPDARQHQTSVNTSQARANADGTVTYAIAPSDPGLANWVDTAGLRQGYILLRWQGFAADAHPEGLLSGFRVVHRADLQSAEFASLPRETAAERQTLLAQRAQEYAYRLHD